MTIALISHPDCLRHEMGSGHPEQPARIQMIEKALLSSPLASFLKPYTAPLATREQLTRAHDEHYIDSIFQIAPKNGLIGLDSDTWMNPYTLSAALRAAGAVAMAVDLVMSHEVENAFCNVRPPGHHAEKNQAMGFCFFNNVLVGAYHALEHYSLKRIAIVDFDVHHGNGTEDIIRDDERILLCSSFQSPFYPYSGESTHNNHILNLPLPASTTGKQLREEVKKHWLTALDQFKPELIFFSAGFDSHAKDPLADLLLQEEDYAWITAQVKFIADRHAQGRMISVLEGGYELSVLGSCVVAHLTPFCM